MLGRYECVNKVVVGMETIQSLKWQDAHAFKIALAVSAKFERKSTVDLGKQQAETRKDQGGSEEDLNKRMTMQANADRRTTQMRC
jgi:hypothetical protein